MYRIVRVKDKVNAHNLFPRVEDSKTREHKHRVRAERFKRDLRWNLFTQRIIGTWNELPEEAIEVR